MPNLALTPKQNLSSFRRIALGTWPLVPYRRVPLLIALGAVKEEPVVEDGRILPGKMVRALATFDHRVLDGMHAAKTSTTLKRVFADPEKELGPLPPERD